MEAMRFGAVSGPASPAVVLLLPRVGRALWDPEVTRLLDDLQDRLGGAYVSHARLDGGTPSIDDALAAARFLGHAGTLVVHPPGTKPLSVPPTARLLECPIWEAEAIARAVRPHLEAATGSAVAVGRRGPGEAYHPHGTAATSRPPAPSSGAPGEVGRG